MSFSNIQPGSPVASGFATLPTTTLLPTSTLPAATLPPASLLPAATLPREPLAAATLLPMQRSPSSPGKHLSSPAIGQRSPVDEVTAQLQRRLAQEASERDASKLILQRLKSTVDTYRQRLQTLLMPLPPGVGGTGENPSMAQRGREVVRELETEVRKICQGGAHGYPPAPAVSSGSPTKGSNYEVLRQSLTEMQRRCESLNSDMVCQAEANDELVETLGTVKDSNKRLLEQIRSQTAEISQLTQQRVSDEARMDQMTRKHEVDRDHMRQETQRQVLAVREAGSERHNLVYQQLTDKLRHVRTRGDILRQEVKRLQNDSDARQNDVANLVSSMLSQMACAERDLANQCALPLRFHEQRKAAAEDNIGDLRLRLTAEREARQNEGLSWSHKHGSVLTEKEGVETRMTRDVAQLSMRLQAAERLALAERHAIAEERAGLERQADEYPGQRVDRQKALDQLQRDTISLDSSISATTSEIANLDHQIVQFKRQSRESDDALAAAVSSNEHLREQMEEQRTRFHDKNEADLADCRASYEQKIHEMRLAAEADAAMTTKQIEAMEVDLRSQEEELDRLNAQVEVACGDSGNLEREVATWRSQFDAATNTREVAEKKLQEERQTFQHERLKLQATSEQLGSLVAMLEDECRQTGSELQDFRRAASARETEHATRHTAAESALKDLTEALAVFQARSREVQEQHKRILAEDSENRERSLEMQAMLERNLDSQMRLRDDEKRRLAELFDQEKHQSEQVRGNFLRERDSTTMTLRRVHGESRDKLAGAEREKNRVEETCRMGITDANQAVSQWQQKLDSLERDLGRVHSLKAESEANLQWILQERGQEEREATFVTRQLEDEIRALNGTLELARRDETAIAQQIEGQRLRNQEERANMQRVLDHSGASQKTLSSPRRRNPPMTVR